MASNFLSPLAARSLVEMYQRNGSMKEAFVDNGFLGLPQRPSQYAAKKPIKNPRESVPSFGEVTPKHSFSEVIPRESSGPISPLTKGL